MIARAPLLLALSIAVTACWTMQEAYPGTDTETGPDSDTDTDSDTDCSDLPEHCCSADCPCVDDYMQCVPGTLDDDGPAGVCKEYILDACWTNADCWDGVACIGAFVCPCYWDCSEEDNPGWCSTGSASCCQDSNECLSGEVCLPMPVEFTDTCHAILDWPYCWTDDDCDGAAVCDGAMLCSCEVDCLSQPGTCSDYWD